MKLFTIPNYLTLLNLSCGVLSSIFIISSNGNVTTLTVSIVMIFMIISLVADFLDGMVARLMGIGSPIGKELDSLADCISFGVVPGLMLFAMFNNIATDFIYETDTLKISVLSLFALLVPAFSALRLAKFNLDEDQATYFKGLATPSNTLFIFSIFSIFFNNEKIINPEIDPYLLIAISVIFSIMLIIDLPLFAFKFKGLGWQENNYKYIFLIITIGLLAAFQIAAIPFVILIYIIISILFRKKLQMNLTKNICFFDLETTGTNIAKDRIVEISIVKALKNGEKEVKTWKVNPGIPIPPETTAIHGISDEDVKDAPSFKEIAPQIVEMIKDSDLAGFNSNRFDIPLLAEELIRNDFDFDLTKHRPIDVQVIYHKMEPRNLSAAYKYYCDAELTDAHSAEADTLATYEVFKAQIEKYEELQNDNQFLSEFSNQRKTADLAGFIQIDDDGNEIISFGKYKGQKVAEVFAKDPGYYAWIQNADFPLYTKKVFTRIKLKSSF